MKWPRGDVPSHHLDSYYMARWTRSSEKVYLSPAKTRRMRIIAQCLEELGPYKFGSEAKVLDYGCGSGWLLPLLKSYGFNGIWAYDVTPRVLDGVTEQYPWARVIKGDGSFPSPVTAETFDFVVSVEVLEHIPYNNKASYLEDIQRILVPRGTFLLTTPNGIWRKYALSPHEAQPVEDWVTLRQLRQYARTSGFRIIKIGSAGMDYYYRMGDSLLCGTRIRRIFVRIGLWEPYRRLLEQLGLGITIFAVLEKS